LGRITHRSRGYASEDLLAQGVNRSRQDFQDLFSFAQAHGSALTGGPKDRDAGTAGIQGAASVLAEPDKIDARVWLEREGQRARQPKLRSLFGMTHPLINN
jgi:hypothetical protein